VLHGFGRGFTAGGKSDERDLHVRMAVFEQKVLGKRGTFGE
jgi:hypothetical protein